MEELSSLEGKLSKYTNVVKGWQNRYFVINIQMGMLEYHIGQSEATSSNGKPRGALALSGAVIAPSIDDELTFSVNATNGEVYKLRASSTKERQKWISRLRSVAHHFTAQIAQEHPPLSNQRKPRSGSFKAQISSNLNKFKDTNPAVEISHSSFDGSETAILKSTEETKLLSNQVQQLSTTGNSTSSLNKLSVPQESSLVESVSAPGGIQNFAGRERSDSQSSMNRLTRTTDAARILPKSTLGELKDVREMLLSTDNYHAGLMNLVENLHDSVDIKPSKNSSDDFNVSSLALDKDILLLKATSTAMLQSLSASYVLLHKHHLRYTSALPQNASISWVEPRKTATAPVFPVEKAASLITVASFESPILSDPKEEVKDAHHENEQDLGPVDEHKNVIMHLLSQLKLGMDLTKVTLPTFILEKRSLLEMYADFLGHADLFLGITEGSSAENRMCRVLKFYLSSFHTGRRSQTAKKPYNPIIGEVFQCSYYVPINKSYSKSETVPPPSSSHHRLKFLAEQVSHHPPVSAFFVSCPEKKIQLNSHLWTKSRFMNMTVGVNIIGEGTLSLLDLDEHYVMNYPSAYARSILTVPWSELGGRCTITCAKTGYSASVNFHTKPAYGGQPHRIAAEVKDPSGFVCCRADGKWNASVEFTYYKIASPKKPVSDSKPQTEIVEFSKLRAYSKYVTPLDKQCQMESRKLWFHVTESLRKGDIMSATQYKKSLEDQQREVEAKRAEDRRPLQNAFFTRTKGTDYDRYFVNENVK